MILVVPDCNGVPRSQRLIVNAAHNNVLMKIDGHDMMCECDADKRMYGLCVLYPCDSSVSFLHLATV
jgi:hypothetical protein